MKKKKKNLFLFRPILLIFLFFISLFLTPTSYAQIFETSYWAVTPRDAFVNCTAWSPDGKYVAFGYDDGFTFVYSFNDATLTYVTQYPTDSASGQVHAIAWSPNGKTLAIGGDEAGAQLKILSFDGSTLWLYPYGTNTYNTMLSVYSLAWTADLYGYGAYLAAGCQGSTGSTDDIFLFFFESTGLAFSNSYHYGNTVYTTAWSPDNKTLAIGGGSTTDNPVYGDYNVQLFTLEPSYGVLTRLPDSALYANGSPELDGCSVFSLAWSPDGKHLAIGGTTGVYLTRFDNVKILDFDKSHVTLLPNSAACSYDGEAHSVIWGANGTTLTVAGTYPANGMNIQMFNFSGSQLTSLTGDTELPWGIELKVYSIGWNPAETFLVAGGTSSIYTDGAAAIVFERLGTVDGSMKTFYAQKPLAFLNGGIATGYTQFKNGFSVGRGKTLDLDLPLPIHGPLSIEYSGTLNLKNDIYLGSDVSLTSSHGYISGNGHTLFLNNNVTTIDNTALHISSDTIINGQNNTLTLGKWSQILIDTNVTLTLKNITLKNSINSQGLPIIKCAAQTSKLALDNVTLWPTNDFYFNEGQLYIHDDVIFTGTSQFIYKTGQASFIAPGSTLTFEPNTTFFYDTINSYTSSSSYLPASNKIYPRNNQLINMQDTTSALYLNGCTMQVSHTGLKLTKGQIFFENNVTLKNNSSSPGFSSLSAPLSGQDFGTYAHSVAWSPDGKYLAVGGNNGSTGLIIYQWTGSTLVALGAGAQKNITAQSVAWSPDGKYLAAGLSSVNSEGYINIYQWNGATLSYITSIGIYRIFSLCWSPDGKYIAAGYLGDSVQENTSGFFAWVYNFNGTSLSLVSSAAIGNDGFWSNVSVSWSPDGKYLAFGTSRPTDGTNVNNVQIYSFANATLSASPVQQVYWGSSYASSFAYPLWAPEGRYLALGGALPNANHKRLEVYNFENEALALDNANRIDYGTSGGAAVEAKAFSPDGQYLAVGGISPDDNYELQIYSFLGGKISATPIAEADFGAAIYSIAWSPDSKYIAVGGDNNSNDIAIYQFNTTTQILKSAQNLSLFFGNATLGSSYNLGINVLKNAKITVNGSVFPNNA